MTKCPICYNEYGAWRLHCPTCGASRIVGETFDVGNIINNKLQVITAARGCVRQNPTFARVLNFRTVDERG